MRLTRQKIQLALLGCGIVVMVAPQARATKLKAATAAAFERYIHASEERMAGDLRQGRFLVLDRLPSGRREEAYAKVRQGLIYMEPMRTLDDRRAIAIPSGLVHHWVGVMFVPGATVSQVLRVLQDYDNHQNLYKPDVRRSQLLRHTDNRFEIYVQFYKKAIVTVVINANFEAEYTQLGGTRTVSKSYSTRIAEVQNAGTPKEREFPVGNDHGYLWRLDNYWHLEEKDGGVYVQIEWVALSRRVPAIFAWLVNPLIRSIPRAVISNLLLSTRKAVLQINPPQTGSPPA